MADGSFDADGVHERKGWGYVYHLHGSVHHSLVGQFGDAIRWEPDLGAKFHDGHSGGTDKRSDNLSLPKTSLIAGGFKLDQLLVEPFQSLHAALIRHVYEADAILIGGYGFGDEHINRALQNRLQGQGSRPPVMVLTWPPNVDPTQFRRDGWSWPLSTSLHAPTDFFREPGHSSTPFIPDLVRGGGFEVSIHHKVAIWHGGYIEAANRLDAIVPWLAGEADDLVLASRRPSPAVI